MAKITVDLTKKISNIKPMHAGGQPPILGNHQIDKHFHYLSEAGVPYSRLHDVGGLFGGNRFVDIPNLFRDFSADENDPNNYDFAFTDALIEGLMKAGVEPYFRLGVTIENGSFIKAYRIAPPEDYEKWARICEMVIRHYTEGWADGYTYQIRYWEIWNEPDGIHMWTGTPEQYYELYDVAAKHLKKCFPHLKFGGFSSTGFSRKGAATNPNAAERLQNRIDFFENFLKYIKEQGSPLDFFSWHSYDEVREILQVDKWVKERLTAHGFSEVEIHLNEWNPNYRTARSAEHAAGVAAVMLALQNGYTDLLCIYDMRLSASYNALFDCYSHKPHRTYYDFVMFNALYKLGGQVQLSCDVENIYAVCATDGERNAMMLVNLSGSKQVMEFEGVDLKGARVFVTDEERMMTWAPDANVIENNAVVLIEF